MENLCKTAVQTFLDQRKAQFDAIIAVHEDMAYGAIEELNKRGINVPDDIAVAGLGISGLCEYAIPSLTAVQKNSNDKGMRAVELLLALIQGKQIADETHVQNSFIIRESCGCLQWKNNALAYPRKRPDSSVSIPAESINILKADKMQILSSFPELNRLEPDLIKKQWGEELYATFYGDFIEYDNQFFRGNINKTLHNNQEGVSLSQEFNCQAEEALGVEMPYVLPSPVEKEWIEELCRALYCELLENKHGFFFTTLNSILYNRANMEFNGEKAFYWQYLIKIFMDNFYSSLTGDLLSYMENIWKQAREAVNERSRRFGILSQMKA